MRVLLIHRYFWPDTAPYASLLFEIAKHLESDGHTVEVLTSFPSYKSQETRQSAQTYEQVDGVTINRVKLFSEASMFGKILNMLYFPIRVFLYILLNRKIDIIMCSTVPAVTMGFSTALGAKFIGSRFVYHCMDLHPEIGRISGEFSNRMLFNLLLWADCWTCKSSDTVVVLSEDMKNSLMQRNDQLDEPQVINNFPLPSYNNESVKPIQCSDLLKAPGKFRVLFAGNIGRFQNLHAFVDAMHILREHKEIELVFVGEGVELESLKNKVDELKLANILFFGHQSVGVARRMMADADLGIVSLAKDVYKYAFPSKTMTYLEETCPLLLCVENESELRNMVTKNKLGFCALPGDAQSISNAILVAHKDSDNYHQYRQRSSNFVESNFSQKQILSRWSTIFADRAQ